VISGIHGADQWSQVRARVAESIWTLLHKCGHLRQFGGLKHAKGGDVQVLLTLMVTRDGLAVSYEVFAGSTWEGHSFLPVLESIHERLAAGRSVYVADVGMFSKDNLDQLDAHGCRYIVGARLFRLALGSDRESPRPRPLPQGHRDRYPGRRVQPGPPPTGGDLEPEASAQRRL